MDKLNVLIVSRQGLHQGYLEDIAAVDPRISVKDGMKEFVTELRRTGKTGILVDRLEAELNPETSRQVTKAHEGARNPAERCLNAAYPDIIEESKQGG